MATPAMLKKIDDKKLAAQKRREKQQEDQLLPLSGMMDAPSAHLLVSGNPNPAPRMMDLRPLGGGGGTFPKFGQKRQLKPEDFAMDQQNYLSGLQYTSFAGEGGRGGGPSLEPSTTHNPPPMMMGKPLGKSKPQKRMPGTGEMPPPKLQPQPVEQAPEGADLVEYTVRANNLVCFYGKAHFLSTLFPVDITIDGHQYPSVEHYYQACKIFSLVGPEQAQLLRLVQDPLKAKSKAREILGAWKIPNREVDYWKKTHGMLVLLHGNRHKFRLSEMRERLLATGDALLCQAYDRDSLYAVGMTEQQLREWARENEGKVLKFPVADLTEDKIKYLPMVGKGKNVLGVLCMQVRKAIRDTETGQQPPEPTVGEAAVKEEDETQNETEEEDGTEENSSQSEEAVDKELADLCNSVLDFGNNEDAADGKENKTGGGGQKEG